MEHPKAFTKPSIDKWPRAFAQCAACRHTASNMVKKPGATNDQTSHINSENHIAYCTYYEGNVKLDALLQVANVKKMHNAQNYPSTEALK